MVKKGLVAICVPAYKNIDFLKRLLDSVFQQDYNSICVCITDDTPDEKVKKFILQYQRVEIQYKKNLIQLGSTANCNEAIRLALLNSPEFIKVMHHDDFFTYSYSLRKMVETSRKYKDCQMVFSGTRQVEDVRTYDREILEEQEEEFRDDYRYLYRENVIGAPSAVLLMVRPDMKFLDESLRWLVDVDWYLSELNGHNRKAFAIKEPLISIGISGEQLTNECMKDDLLIIKEYIYIYIKYDFLHTDNYREYLKKRIMDTLLKKDRLRDIESFGMGLVNPDIYSYLSEEIKLIQGIVDCLKNKNVLVFGVGRFCRRRLALLGAIGNIVCFCDNNPDNYGRMILDRPITSPNRICEFDYDGILIMTPQHYESITGQIKMMDDTIEKKILPVETVDMLKYL